MFSLDEYFNEAELKRNGLFSTLGRCDADIPNTLAFCDSIYYLRMALRNPNVTALVTTSHLQKSVDDRLGCIVSEVPMNRFYQLHQQLVGHAGYRCNVEHYIAPTAKIHPTAVIGDRCNIGEHVEIGPYVHIADDSVIGDGAYIATGAVIGAEGILYYEDGDRIRAVRHGGGVWIGREAQILAQAVIAKAIHPPALTRVGDRSIIGIATTIGHEAQVGSDCIVQGNCVLARQCVVDDGSLISSGSVVREYTHVGCGAVVRAGSVVVDNVPAQGEVSGNFARDHRQHLREFMAKKEGK